MVSKDRNGHEVFNHEGKGSIIWEACKERLGMTEFSQMQFNLSEILEPMGHLEHLIEPFTSEEIDNITKNLPSGKSPRPDGLNTDFMKNAGV
jgi:hypothetical protein